MFNSTLQKMHLNFSSMMTSLVKIWPRSSADLAGWNSFGANILQFADSCPVITSGCNRSYCPLSTLCPDTQPKTTLTFQIPNIIPTTACIPAIPFKYSQMVSKSRV